LRARTRLRSRERTPRRSARARTSPS
jgi:hypothetical protein